MRSILQRLRGRFRSSPVGRPRTSGRRVFTCYLRENGPIAYELALFDRSPRERADAMIDSGLRWAWKTRRREWTHLTRVSLSAFLSDLSGELLLMGLDEDLPTDITDAVVKEWVRRFTRVQPVPLAAVINMTGAQQLLFVQQHAPDAVNGLLEGWGLDKSAAARQAYAKLGPATLESVVDRL